MDLPWRPVIVFEPSAGRVELTQRLPFQWDDFLTAPKPHRLGLLAKAVAAKQSLWHELDLTQRYYDLVDALVKLQPAASLRRVVPPFGSHATIAGTQHYMTFDGKFYEFAGECSYLLVGDFYRSNFSVVVNYEGADGRVVRKSLTIVSDGRRIQVDSRFRVSVDNHKVRWCHILRASCSTSSAIASTESELIADFGNTLADLCRWRCRWPSARRASCATASASSSTTRTATASSATCCATSAPSTSAAGASAKRPASSASTTTNRPTT